MVVYPWLSTPFFDLVSGVLFPLHVNICLHFFLFFFWFWKICNYLGYLMCCVFFSDFSYCSLKDFNKKDFWQPNRMGIRLDRLQHIWSVCPVRKKSSIQHSRHLFCALYPSQLANLVYLRQQGHWWITLIYQAADSLPRLSVRTG